MRPCEPISIAVSPGSTETRKTAPPLSCGEVPTLTASRLWTRARTIKLSSAEVSCRVFTRQGHTPSRRLTFPRRRNVRDRLSLYQRGLRVDQSDQTSSPNRNKSGLSHHAPDLLTVDCLARCLRRPALMSQRLSKAAGPSRPQGQKIDRAPCRYRRAGVGGSLPSAPETRSPSPVRDGRR